MAFVRLPHAAGALMAFTLAACAPAPTALSVAAITGREPVVGGPCEGCELVFAGLPAELPSSARIAPVGEPGTPLTIHGTVRHADGSPAPGTVVYAYHTDANGVYRRDGLEPGDPVRAHGAFRAWVAADERGEFRFETIRPGGYPGRPDPEHVHLHVIEPGRCTYYLESIVFTDDPRFDPDAPASAEAGRGGPGTVTPTSTPGGGWSAQRDIVLGAGIDGYPAGRR